MTSSRFTAGGGRADAPAVFYDVLEPVGGASRPPIMMMHGGGHTGACYQATVDGRPGWAPYFAARGHRVFVPDWPGHGRSGSVPLDRLDGALVHSGLADVLCAIGEPAILFSHSMSGTFGWKLLESHGTSVRKLVAVAPAPPGNIQAPATTHGRGPDFVEVEQPSGTVRLKLDAPFFPPAFFVDKKLIGDGTQFPADLREAYRASLQPVSPRLILERMNVDARQLRVTDFTHYAGKPVLVVIATHDLDHDEPSDRPIADWLHAHGADVQFLDLGTRGIVGNGHMMMMERNSDQVAAVLAEWLDG